MAASLRISDLQYLERQGKYLRKASNAQISIQLSEFNNMNWDGKTYLSFFSCSLFILTCVMIVFLVRERCVVSFVRGVTHFLSAVLGEGV